MSAPTSPATPTISRRAGWRIGYSVAIIVNLLVYCFINVWPGWESLDFVTPAAADVVPLVNISIGVAILVNVVYLVADGTRIKALGEMVSAAVTLVASVVVLSVFPFDFSAYAFPWELVTRVVLVIAVVGSAISVLVNLYRLVRGPVRKAATSPTP
ncbi:MAG: hypothetical protein Q8M17_05425 [Actinomycetota bacterium]|nr:hypothetical protein [Actinomycetota bacterium]